MNTEPLSLTHLLTAWNETDPQKIGNAVAMAVSPDVEFVDPNYAVRGLPAFLGMILEFRARYPKARCLRTSGVDAHHNRARYHWRVVMDDAAFVDGMDSVEFDALGRVRRIDGFFGVLKIDAAVR